MFWDNDTYNNKKNNNTQPVKTVYATRPTYYLDALKKEVVSKPSNIKTHQQTAIKNVYAPTPRPQTAPIFTTRPQPPLKTRNTVSEIDLIFSKMDKLTLIPEPELFKQIEEYRKLRGRPDPVTKRNVSSLKPLIISISKEDNLLHQDSTKVYYKSNILARPDYQVRMNTYYKKYNCDILTNRDYDNEVWRIIIYPQ